MKFTSYRHCTWHRRSKDNYRLTNYGPMSEDLTSERCGKREGKSLKCNVVDYVDYTFAIARTVLFGNYPFPLLSPLRGCELPLGKYLVLFTFVSHAPEQRLA